MTNPANSHVKHEKGREPKLHTAFAGFREDMLGRIKSCSSAMIFEAGMVPFSRGARDVAMFVVLSGQLDIYDQDGDGPEHVIASLRRGQFTGELDLLDNRPALVTCRAKTRSKVLQVDREALRRLMRSDVEIADIVMQACIGRRFDLVRHASGGALLIGLEHSAETIRLQRFLTRNRFPFQILNPETNNDAGSLIRSFDLDAAELPVVVLPSRTVLRNPTNPELADALELTDLRDFDVIYDVAIVGAGPAGLAAAVYAASEGLSTTVIEGSAPGGQAGTSSRIENYLGFPTGVSGQELSERSQIQAQKFGARFMISRDVSSLTREGGLHSLVLMNGESVKARTIVIATGAKYQRLNIPDYDRFEYQGIHYAATAMEAGLCRGEEVAVVGAGNSAGQAALFLSRTAERVHLLVRGNGLEATMSDYLVQRILASRTISLHLSTEIVALGGGDRLSEVTWIEKEAAQPESRQIGNIFVMIGACPRSEWLRGSLKRDTKGFIVTGMDAGSTATFGTSVTGVFAVGDVRSGSVKRVASAVGEGSVVISEVHQYLASLMEPQLHDADRRFGERLELASVIHGSHTASAA
jgi:thioredoxin reductase (NADPH)